MFSSLLQILLLVQLVSNQVNCANILIISHLPSRSHHLWHEALSVGLVRNGHNVTMLSHYSTNRNLTNFNLILLEDSIMADFDLEEFGSLNWFEFVKSVHDITHQLCINDARTDGFKQLLNYPKEFKFDIILWDIYVSQCMYPLMDLFDNPPIIGTSPYGLEHTFAQMFGNPIPFYPYSTSGTTYEHMNYLQRLEHHLNVNFMVWYYKLIYLPAQYRVAKKIFPNLHINDLETYERKIKLLLTNTHPLYDYAVPLTPNIIPVGGLHIEKPKKLPNDIQILLDDNNDDGIVYFALGSNIKPQKLKKFNLILKALEMIPYKILWKIDTDDLNIKFPNNVITMKWCPQNEILAHKNVKLFISHGGALSTQEALYHGVPMLIIPLFLDQIKNSERLSHKKYALRIPYEKLTTENIYESAMEVLNNPMYKENVKKSSRMLKDQLNEPMDIAVHWIEYVLKYKDMDYMDVINRDMYFYETIHLDLAIIVLFILILIVGLVLTISYYCCKYTKKTRSNKKFKKQ